MTNAEEAASKMTLSAMRWRAQQMRLKQSFAA